MSSDYYYDYYGYEESYAEMTDMLIGFVGIALVVGLIALVIGIICYVLESLGIYTVAKRRGIRGAWLSWLPIGNIWMWGCISDDYQLKAKGQKKNLRWILLVLMLANLVLSWVTSAIGGAAVMEFIANIEQIEYMSEAEALEMMAPVMGAAPISLLSGIVSIVLMVFQYIALFHIYKSCDPSNAVLYLVLSILFGIARPFFLFFNRKKDLGLPSYRQPDRPEPWQQGNIPL